MQDDNRPLADQLADANSSDQPGFLDRLRKAVFGNPIKREPSRPKTGASRTKSSGQKIQGAFGKHTHQKRLNDWKNSCEHANRVRDEELKRKAVEGEERMQKMLDSIDPEQLKNAVACLQPIVGRLMDAEFSPYQPVEFHMEESTTWFNNTEHEGKVAYRCVPNKPDTTNAQGPWMLTEGEAVDAFFKTQIKEQTE